MQIFKYVAQDQQDDDVFLNKLIDNGLNLKEKIDNLVNSYAALKLSDNINNLIKILFEKNGGEVYFPRVGDNSERFDALITYESKEYIAEIEVPSIAILDAPRNLLDDYAVGISRNKKIKKDAGLIVICWDLPNKRTDYWNVIDDVQKVLGKKIYTVPILSLAIQYWCDEPFALDDYFLSSDNQKIQNSLNALARCGVKDRQYNGYLTPYK